MGWLPSGDRARFGSGLLPAFFSPPDPALAPRVLALALHAASSLLAWSLARRLGLAARSAWLVGALFAVHPSSLETVAWLVQGNARLGTCLFLFGSWLVLGASGPGMSARRARFAAAAVIFGAVLASPGLTLALPWLYLGLRWNPQTRAHSADWNRPLLVLFSLGTVLLGLSAPSSPFARAPAVLAALLTWFWPAPLGTLEALADHPLWVLACWLLLLVAYAGLVALGRRSPSFVLGMLFALLATLHGVGSGSLSPLGAAYAAGFGLALACGTLFGSSRIGELALCLFAVLLGQRTWLGLATWRGDEGVWQRSTLGADAPALIGIGELARAHGRLSAAQRAFERAAELDPRSVEARLCLGKLELRRGLVPGNEEHLRGALEILGSLAEAHPDHPELLACLGEVQQRAGMLEPARATLERARALAPRDAEAATHLGMVHLGLGARETAAEVFRAATELDPEAQEAWCGLGLALEFADEPASRAAFERALALEPESPEALAGLARAELAAGEHDAALDHLRRAIAVFPDNVEALYDYGAALAEGNSADALRTLDRAVALRPPPKPHVRASLLAARLHLARGELEVARRLVEAVLDFNPEQVEARALQRQLGERDERR
jgi:tetratricopeptide (TPR) repeat protein